MRRFRWNRIFLTFAVLGLLVGLSAQQVQAQFVPGSGFKIDAVGDDFEDEKWAYVPNWPKASQNLDGQTRHNLGEATNGRWYESAYRGQPDVIRRVKTPPGGLPGSKGSLLLKSKFTGIPEMITRKQQQDDFLANVNGQIGSIPVNYSPSVVVRVFLPPWEEWEQRTGATFGFRADCEGVMTKEEKKRGLFGTRIKQVQKVDAYWPGFFIQYNCKKDPRFDRDSALLLYATITNNQFVGQNHGKARTHALPHLYAERSDCHCAVWADRHEKVWLCACLALRHNGLGERHWRGRR